MAEISQVLGGKYEVQKLLGRGGMSCVYLVEDIKLQKKWAVKEISRKQNPEMFFERAKIEIIVMKKLDHPALPRIVDMFEESACIYVVMDYIEGENLDVLLQKKEMIPQEKILLWAKELCEVLVYLHEQNPPIIYRDMKPANIMISKSGNVKLVDFGISREYKVNHQADTISLGSKGYAAPEQFAGEGQSDVRTDIYSFGVTLYHILTGIHPWEVSGSLFSHTQRKIRLSGAWEHIIKGCTWRNPNLRYQTGRELLRDLKNFEKLEKRYQRKERGIKKVPFFILAGIVLYSALNYQEMMVMLPSEVLECIKAEKIKHFSALREILDFLFQKICQFFNL